MIRPVLVATTAAGLLATLIAAPAIALGASSPREETASGAVHQARDDHPKSPVRRAQPGGRQTHCHAQRFPPRPG